MKWGPGMKEIRRGVFVTETSTSIFAQRGNPVSDEQTPRRPGVEFRPPPSGLLGPISAAVDAYAETLGPDDAGGVVGIATTAGINGAIVQKLGGKGTIVGWIGKSWGVPDLEAGLAWKLRW